MPDDPNDVIIPPTFSYEKYKTQIIDMYRGLKDHYMYTTQDGNEELHEKYHKHIAELTDDLLYSSLSKTRGKKLVKKVVNPVRLIEMEHNHVFDHFFATVMEVLDRIDNKVNLMLEYGSNDTDYGTDDDTDEYDFEYD